MPNFVSGIESYMTCRCREGYTLQGLFCEKKAVVPTAEQVANDRRCVDNAECSDLENAQCQFDLVKSRAQLVAEKRRKNKKRKKDDKKNKKKGGRQLIDTDSLLEDFVSERADDASDDFYSTDESLSDFFDDDPDFRDASHRSLDHIIQVRRNC